MVALSEQLKAIERNTPSIRFYFEHGKIALGYFSGRPSLANYISVINTETSEALLLHLNEPCVSCDGAITLLYSYDIDSELTVEAMQNICEDISAHWSELCPNDRICINARAHPLSVKFAAIGLPTEWVGTLDRFNSISYTGILMKHGIFIVDQLSNVNFAFVQMNDGKIINAGLLVNQFNEVVVCYKCSPDIVQFCTSDGAFSLAFVAELTNTVNRLLKNNQLINRVPLMTLCIKARDYGSESSSSVKAAPSESSSSVKAAPSKAPLDDTLISVSSYCVDCGSYGFYTVSQQCDGCCSCCQYARDYHGSSIKVKTRQQHGLCNICADGKCGYSKDYESHMIALFRK